MAGNGEDGFLPQFRAILGDWGSLSAFRTRIFPHPVAWARFGGGVKINQFF